VPFICFGTATPRSGFPSELTELRSAYPQLPQAIPLRSPLVLQNGCVLPRKSGKQGIHAVGRDALEHAVVPPSRVGDIIPTSGIYRAQHGDHRLAHEVTLLSGDVFPRCSQCGESVTFELVAAADAVTRDRDFAVRLYEIPHPDAKPQARTEPPASPDSELELGPSDRSAIVHLRFGVFYADIIPDEREPGLFQYVIQREGSPDVLALGACNSQDAACALADRLMREFTEAAPLRAAG
jgi:hypothetical protein